jgi:hypothetical protein
MARSPIEPIKENDIMYQDDLVCILRPEIKKGIIIWSHYTQPHGMNSLCKTGLKTGKLLQEEGIDFGRTTIHPYIFFRAPYYSNEIDYSTPNTEIISSYGEEQIGIEQRVFIRVDPDKTFVFSSEITGKYSPQYRYNSPEYKRDMLIQLNASKKTLSEYLIIIKQNKDLKMDDNKKYLYNLYSSVKKEFPKQYNLNYPWDNDSIEKNSEILVSIPHLTPEYFVLCT